LTAPLPGCGFVDARDTTLCRRRACVPQAIEETPAFIKQLPRPLQRLDLLKLWKALFYNFWMSDKVPVQQELAAKLANLVRAVAACSADTDALRRRRCQRARAVSRPRRSPCVRACPRQMHGMETVQESFLFCDVFFETMLREWGGIDRLR
jgi:hypothetical protein